MDELVPFWAIASIILGVASAVYVVVRYPHIFTLFSKTSHRADIGPLTFRLNYVYALRNPSGRMIFVWTDELGRTYEQGDPRVLAMETTASGFSRLLRRESEPDKEKYAMAVKKHIGHGRGWLSVSSTDVYRFPILRHIAFCVSHLEIKPAPKHETVTD